MTKAARKTGQKQVEGGEGRGGRQGFFISLQLSEPCITILLTPARSLFSTLPTPALHSYHLLTHLNLAFPPT